MKIKLVVGYWWRTLKQPHMVMGLLFGSAVVCLMAGLFFLARFLGVVQGPSIWGTALVYGEVFEKYQDSPRDLGEGEEIPPGTTKEYFYGLASIYWDAEGLQLPLSDYDAEGNVFWARDDNSGKYFVYARFVGIPYVRDRKMVMWLHRTTGEWKRVTEAYVYFSTPVEYYFVGALARWDNYDKVVFSYDGGVNFPEELIAEVEIR